MTYREFLIFYLFVCSVDLISAIIYSCDKAVDCGCSATNANVDKIVGGENSHPESWGWAVSIQSDSHFCTGSIVSPLHIITAAHCVTDPIQMASAYAIVGIDDYSKLSPTFQVRKVHGVFSHPDYNHSNQMHDIAVLRLNESLNISSEAATARICLPQVQPPRTDADYPANSATLVAIGWGLLESEGTLLPSHLKQVTLKAVSYKDQRCEEFITNNRSQFCAGVNGGGKDTCQGDSGGPLMRFESAQKRWVLAGVTSFGLGCGDPRYTGVYTRASFYLDWLRTVVNDGFIQTSANAISAANENCYNIYIALLSIVQLCFVSLWNKK